MISSSPNQKEGIDTPIREVAVARLSKMEYCLVGGDDAAGHPDDD